MPVIVLTSGTQWLVPPDCRTATIEAVGAGSYNGGSYAKSTNVSFTPGSFVNISIAAGASGGKTWLNTSSTPRYMPKYITWSGTQFVALDNTNNIITSPDGVTWTQKPGLTSIFNTEYLSIAANGSNIVVCPESSAFTQVAISSGTSWSAVTLPTGAYIKYPVWFVNGTFIVSSINNSAFPPTIYQFASTDNGASWTTTSTRVTSSAPNRIEYNASPVIYENSLYTTVGSYIPTSGPTPFGVGYSSSASGAQTIITQATLGFTGYVVSAIAYGAGLYVVVGENGLISTAPTLTSAWTPRTSGVTDGLSSVIFDGTKFIVAISGGLTGSNYYRVLVSSDGITWTLSTTTSPVSGLVPANSLFNTGSGIYAIAGISISKTINSGTSWSQIFIGDGSPLSVSTGVSAAGGGISPLVQSINSIYTSGAGNFYQGGTVGVTSIGCCFDVQGGFGGGAGPNGQGGNGGDYGAYGAGGGGAANYGGNGAVGGGYVGGFGGTSRTGSLGGAGGTISTPGGSGTNGSGGGGGVATYSAGGAGSLETITAWTDFAGATYGVGSGGGGQNGPAGGPGGGGTGTLGQGIIVITYTSQPLSGTYTQVVTSTQNIYVPSGVTSLVARAIGPGSQGGRYTGVLENGGGGGAYAESTITSPASGAGYANVPSASVWGATADTWFRASGNTAPTTSAEGALAKGASNGTGGAASPSSIGSTTYAGGNGGASILQTSTTNKQRGGGGGGAAGPSGVGRNGGSASTAAATSANGGGGGGGGTNAGSSTVGGTPVITTTTGGVGGTGPTGTAGGSGGTTTVVAGAGSNGSGGGGGSASTSTTNIALRHGAAGSQFNVSTPIAWVSNGINYGPGSGGGGGGIGVSTTLFGNGGAAGGYGGGGGAASGTTAAAGVRGSGTGGLVVLTYTVVGVTNTSNFFLMF